MTTEAQRLHQYVSLETYFSKFIKPLDVTVDLNKVSFSDLLNTLSENASPEPSSDRPCIDLCHPYIVQCFAYAQSILYTNDMLTHSEYYTLIMWFRKPLSPQMSVHMLQVHGVHFPTSNLLAG